VFSLNNLWLGRECGHGCVGRVGHRGDERGEGGGSGGGEETGGGGRGEVEVSEERERVGVGGGRGRERPASELVETEDFGSLVQCGACQHCHLLC